MNLYYVTRAVTIRNSLSVRFAIAENWFKLHGAWRSQYYKSNIKKNKKIKVQ